MGWKGVNEVRKNNVQLARNKKVEANKRKKGLKRREEMR